MENTFEAFVKEINKLPDDRYYYKVEDRIDKILKASKDMGWGFYDTLFDIRSDIRWRDE